MPGKCPRCGSRILKRTSRNGYTYYGCERGAECGFMTWDVPVADLCPECGKSMFKTAGRGSRKPFCVNPVCPAFVPEEKRGYRRRSSSAGAGEAAGGSGSKKSAAKKPAKKTAAKKPAAKKTAKKPAAGKTAAKKSGNA